MWSDLKKSAYNLPINGHRGLGWKLTNRKSFAVSLLMWSDMTLSLFFRCRI